MSASSATSRQARGRTGGLESWFLPVRGSAVPPTAPDVVASLRGAPGAYVHVPFCERLCPFCPYNKELHRASREARYFAALREEARWYAEALGGPFYLGLGAGSASYTGRMFTVNEFAVGRYADAIERGVLPIARAVSLRPPADSAYYLFWQAYAGGFSVADLERRFGRLPAFLWQTVAPLVERFGYLRRHGEGYRLTTAGYDRYHDLERWVTYRYIEPLWAELMPVRGCEAVEAPPVGNGAAGLRPGSLP